MHEARCGNDEYFCTHELNLTSLARHEQGFVLFSNASESFHPGASVLNFRTVRPEGANRSTIAKPKPAKNRKSHPLYIPPTFQQIDWEVG